MFLLKVNNEGQSVIIQADTQNYTFTTENNGVSDEQPPSSIDVQNTLTSDNVR